MKVFYVMKNVSWVDRRKGEIAIRYIMARKTVPVEHMRNHFSKRLKKMPTRLPYLPRPKG